MEKNMEFLNHLYRNAKIGEESMGTLLKSVEDDELKRDILTQMEGYTKFESKAKERIRELGGEPEEPGLMKKMMVSGGVKMNTATNHTPKHIAEMLIQGSTMGIIEAKESLSKFEEAERQDRALAEELVRFEQGNIERLKEYL